MMGTTSSISGPYKPLKCDPFVTVCFCWIMNHSLKITNFIFTMLWLGCMVLLIWAGLPGAEWSRVTPLTCLVIGSMSPEVMDDLATYLSSSTSLSWAHSHGGSCSDPQEKQEMESSRHFQVFLCITFAIFPLAKGSHVAKPRIRVRRNTLGPGLREGNYCEHLKQLEYE